MSNGSDINIKIFASNKKNKTYDRTDEKKISDVIKKDVLSKTKVSYHSVSVKVERLEDGAPKALIAYLLRKDSYTADVTKVEVDRDYNVQTVIEDYDDSKEVGDEGEEEIEERGAYESEIQVAVDFVAATPVPEIPSAKEAVENIAKIAASKGLNSLTLLGSDASVANYKRLLRSGLQGFVNVGHGWPGGIVLDDGRLRYTWFESLTDRPLNPGVIYLNSCQVHNPPLQPAVMASGARTYIGGIVNLLIGPSEKVCLSFWNGILSEGAQMKEALLKAEEKNYPSTGAHGFSGDPLLYQTGEIIVFQHANFRGPHRHIFGMERDFNHPEDRNLNDRISSFVVVSGMWEFYQHSHFRKRLGIQYGPGLYSYVGAVGIGNDQISSARCIRA